MELQQIGRRLKEERQAQDLDLSQVQQATKIRMRYLRALEQGDENVFPGTVYLRGFIRTYADYLGLDGMELVQAYGSDRPGEKVLDSERDSMPILPEILTPTGNRPGGGSSLARAAGALLVFVLVAAVTYYYIAPTVLPDILDATQRPSLPGNVIDDGEQPADDDPGDDGAEDPVSSDDQAPANGGDNGSDGSQDGSQEQGDEGEPETEAPLVTREQLDGSNIRYTVETEAELQVTLEAEDRCWLRVTDADGTRLYEGTLQPGDSRTWTAASRLHIRAGAPEGLQVIINGQPQGRPADEGVWNLIFVRQPAASD